MNTKTHTILYAAFSIVAFVVLSGVYWFSYNSIESQTIRTSEILQQIAEEQSRSAHQKSLTKLLDGVRGSQAQLSSFFVPSDRVVEFIEQIESLEKLSGAVVTLQSITAENISEAATSTVGRVDASVSVVGNWASVMKALQLAERLPYSISISGVNVSSAGIVDGASAPKAAKGTSLWRMTFQIQVLSIKQ
ncbi:MAG: hypothetical protein RIT04_541 [Candidatus Parcubacteria bacterium]|jgi:hypothetical protein